MLVVVAAHGDAVPRRKLPSWDLLDPLISDNVAWMDSCKDRLRAVSDALLPPVVEIRYEDLAEDPAAQLRRAAEAIAGSVLTGHDLVTTTDFRRQRTTDSEELRGRWLSTHPDYSSSPLPR